MEKGKRLVLIEGIVILFVASILFFAAYFVRLQILLYLGSSFLGGSIGFFLGLIQDSVASRRKSEQEEIDYEWVYHANKVLF